MPDVDLGSGVAAWRRFVGATLEERDERTPFTLAQLAFLTDPTLMTPGHEPVPGLPAGRPDRATIRGAAAALVEYGEGGRDPLALMWFFLGLQQRVKHYKAPREGEVDELPFVVASVERAIEVGAALGPDTHAWALARYSRILRDAHRNEEALAAGHRAIALLSQAPPAPEGSFAVLAEATGEVDWLPSHRHARTYLLMKAHERAAVAARMLRDYPRAMAERDLQIAAARLLPERPWLLVDALGQRATLGRSVGDVATSLRLLDEQERVTRASGSRPAQIRRLLSAASAAQFFDDWDTSIQLRRERIALRLASLLAGPVEAAPLPLLPAVRELEDAGQRQALDGLGNDAYDIARCLIDSGKASVDAAAQDEARGWLDVAEQAWQDIALNGAVAVEFRRLLLDAIQGAADNPVTVGREMIRLSRAWRRSAGQRRSAVTAVNFGAPGDEVILDRLLELVGGAPAVDAAHLRVGLAQWHLRHGHALAEQGRTAAAHTAWAQAVEHAEAAAAGLSVERAAGSPILLDPVAVIEAHKIAGEGIRARRMTGERSPAASIQAELAVRLLSLPAIAQRFTASGTPAQRQILDQLYGPWLVETLQLAVELDDLDAADRITEVMRRDLVGSVLFAIADDPSAPQQIAALARQLTASLRATSIDAGSETAEPKTSPANQASDGNDEGNQRDVDPTQRAVGVANQLQETLDVVGSVLGPVARTLFDPRTVLIHTATSAARMLFPEGPGALLSLVLVDTPDGPRVVRRLSWRAAPEEPLHEHLDVVVAPSWLPGMTVGDDADTFFARVARLTPVLLPQPLLDQLRAADPDHPLPLTVVPTGLLAVPFAALEIGDRLLLDVAVVSVVQSLQAIETLARPGERAAVEPLEVGVYDMSLPNASFEWGELLQYRPATRSASSLRELTELFADPRTRGGPGVLALAIHGSRGTNGWTQAKKLPNGDLLTSGHVLQWYVPALVVGASCNTDIRSDAGGELGGFPLAFQLRGAVDIIGSLHYIEDEATAQIMALFYAATSAGMGAAAALRQAQRDWIAVNRARRLPTMERWAYLLCYGLPR